MRNRNAKTFTRKSIYLVYSPIIVSIDFDARYSSLDSTKPYGIPTTERDKWNTLVHTPRTATMDSCKTIPMTGAADDISDGRNFDVIGLFVAP